MISFKSFWIFASLWQGFNFMLNNWTSETTENDNLLADRVSENEPHPCGQGTSFIFISERSGHWHCQSSWRATNMEMTDEYLSREGTWVSVKEKVIRWSHWRVVVNESDLTHNFQV